MYFSFKEVKRKEKIFENEKLYENVFPRNFLLLLLFFYDYFDKRIVMYKSRCFTASTTLIQNHSFLYIIHQIHNIST